MLCSVLMLLKIKRGCYLTVFADAVGRVAVYIVGRPLAVSVVA